jgi:hypothetical protein
MTTTSATPSADTPDSPATPPETKARTVPEEQYTEARTRLTDMNASLISQANAVKDLTAAIRKANGIDLPLVSKTATEIDKLMDGLVKSANLAQAGH